MLERIEIAIIDSRRGHYADTIECEEEVLGEHVEVIHLLRVDTPEELFGKIENLSGIISWHHIAITSEVVSRLQRCKGIVRAGVGVDNIDLVAAAKLGIPVANVPDYGTEEVADHTMALLLGAVRRIRVTDQHVRDGGWDWRAIGQVGRLRGRTLGIIGFGRIGRAVCIRAQAFGLKVVFFDPYVPSGTDKTHGVERCESLPELLQQANFLSIHTPLTDETRGLIGHQEFAQMQKDAILINTARGPIVDREALSAAIQERRIAQVALDVVDGEPRIPEYLLRSDNVLLTPHSAFYAAEGMLELRIKTARHMRALLLGRPVRDIVNGVSVG